MRILFVSNFYPPEDRGGYEQWCAEVATALASRRHEVRVLTAATERPTPAVNDGSVRVERVLQLEVVGGVASTFWRAGPMRQRIERQNLEQVQRIVGEFNPERVMFWGMWNIPRGVPALLEDLVSGCTSYYLCDYWPSLPSAWIQQLEVPSRRGLTALAKRILAWPLLVSLRHRNAPVLRFEHVYCVSKAVRQLLVEEGLPLADSGVIYGGTPLDEHPTHALERPNQNTLRLLFAGRLTADKGVHTAIEALALLPGPDRRRITLDIYGRGEPDYEHYLRTLVRERGLTDTVSFRGVVARADMPRVLSSHDVLLLVSEWAEPFARIILEAMASGLVVIGTTVGGTPELLTDGNNGLLFTPGRAGELAGHLERLIGDPALCRRLAEAGQQCVRAKFDFQRMVDDIEVALRNATPEPLSRPNQPAIDDARLRVPCC